jgi:hypothetical protein
MFTVVQSSPARSVGEGDRAAVKGPDGGAISAAMPLRLATLRVAIHLPQCSASGEDFAVPPIADEF